MERLSRKKVETKPVQRTPIPTYDSLTQVSSALDDRWDETYSDPDLYTIMKTASLARQEIDKARGMSLYGAVGGEGLQWALQNVDPRAGSHFQGHGMRYGDVISQLDTLLHGGIDSDRELYTTEFRIETSPAVTAMIGAPHPATERGLILLSAADQHLRESGVKYVVLGEEFMTVVDLMKQKYPEVEFIPWHEAPSRLAEIASEQTGEDYRSTTLTEENRPHYMHFNETLSPSQPINPVITASDEDAEVW